MSVSAPQARDFIAPFPLEKCARRLEEREERPTFWSFDWQQRLKVRVWRVDADTYAFRLVLAPKSWLEFEPIKLVKLEGGLGRLEGGQTQVYAQMKEQSLLILLLDIVLIGGGFFVGVSFLQEVGLIAGLGLGLVFAALFVASNEWWLGRQRRRLWAALHGALGGY
jgi:hypothetical protein